MHSTISILHNSCNRCVLSSTNKPTRTFRYGLILKSLYTLSIILSILSAVSESAIQRSCQCPRQAGIITYNGTCPDSNEMMVVKRTLYAMTPDRSTSDFCSRTVTLDTRHCVIEDYTSAWSVQGVCNSRNGQCALSYTLEDNTFSTCTSQNGFIYACLEFECILRSQSPGTENPTIYLSSSNQRTYVVTSRFHLMTSYYPSPATSSINQCILVVPATANLVLRVYDLRGRFIGRVGDARTCPYLLYFHTGVEYREWCAQTNQPYQEMMVPPSSGSGNRTVDVVFNSQYPDQSAEGAVWITVEASSPSITILCGDSIPLHTVSAPTGTRVVSSTTTRQPAAATTTTRGPVVGPPGSSSTRSSTLSRGQSSSSSSSSTTTRGGQQPGQTTTLSSSSSSTTTRPPVGPPGQQSSTTRGQPGPPGQPSTTVSITRQPSSSSASSSSPTTRTTTTTTTRQPSSTTRQPSSTTTRQSSSTTTTTRQPPSTTTRQPSSSTTTQPQGPSSSSTRRPTGQSPSTTKSRGGEGSSGGTDATQRPPVSLRSFTPGVPTPGVPNNVEALEVKSQSSGNSNVRTVAITVTVIVVGCILIASLIMALIWFFKWRHEESGYQGA